MGFIIALLIIAIVLMAIGGALDMWNKKRLGPISKYHYWADGTFLLVLSGWLMLLSHVMSKST